jgi:PKD repeat protein
LLSSHRHATRLLRSAALITLVAVVTSHALDADAAQATIRWDYTASGASGFMVYCGSGSGSYTTRTDAGNTDTYTLTSLPAGTTSYCAVKAYDASRVESAYSNEVAIVVPATAPTLAFSASPMQGYPPLAVTFSNTSTGDVTAWQWDFGDGTFSSTRSPSHTYSTPGTYRPTLTATGPSGTARLAASAPIVVGNGAATGLVAAFGFTEGRGVGVADASGNGNNGTLVGGVTWVQGRFGPALMFDGVSGRVDIPDSASLRLASGMTLAAWVNPSIVSSAWRDVIYKGVDNYYLMASSSQGSAPAGRAGAVKAFGPGSLPLNTWTYLAVTYDRTAVRLFVNGSLVSTVPYTAPISTSSYPLQLGGDGVFGQYFKGTIDEVRVYNRALSQAEIQRDMSTPVPPVAGDTTPPSTPSTLVASPVSSSLIGLSWGASTDDVSVAGYRVERCPGASCTSFAQVTSVAGTTFQDSGLAAATTYRYRVRAFDSSGNLSQYSAPVAVSTLSGASVPGLVAAYSFNEGTGTTVSDASGNGNKGTLSAGAKWTSQGRFGGAVLFDGISARIDIADSSSLRLTSSMTLEAWVNPAAVSSAWRDVIYKGNDNYYLMATSTAASAPAGRAGSGRVLATSSLPVGTWTHLAVTYDQAAVRLYVDGTLTSSTPYSGAIPTSQNPLQIGGDSIYGQYFKGSIDEVRIYGRALSQSEIQSDMMRAVAP